ncbi:endonuclease domain-containing protein [Candidatus Binatus sp.]|uniref:endonuclease domain-containing protein n=1 Tax=Candidatus Binatus sp. TaxID=2811406 RepID=UPI002F9373F5
MRPIEAPQQNARRLRHEQTDAERILWHYLRARQMRDAKFRRQFPIGPYFADFCSTERRVIIELDGAQHAEQTREDNTRTSFLNGHGYRVLRFWNNQVLADVDEVLRAIDAFLGGSKAE